MLARLSIRNYALIESLEIDFSEGFSVITGETGAGKSIILGALGLILGNRSDASFILDPERKCIVEGTFQIKNYKLEEFFEQNELDFDERCILRREISGSGKSRAFINDTPVQLGVMKSLGGRLLNIHSQHSITTLNDVAFQLALIDDYASLQELVSGYRDRFVMVNRLVRELESLIQAGQKSRTDRDYFQFLYNELESASLKEDEQAEIEQRLEVLTHAEEIRTTLGRILNILSESEQSVLSSFSEMVNLSRNLSKFNNQIGDIASRLTINQIDLKDISQTLCRLVDEISVDPKEMELLAGRLDEIYRLEKKHHVSDVRDLIKLKVEFGLKLNESTSLEQKIADSQELLVKERTELRSLAERISGLRRKVIPELEKNIVTLLTQLGMPDARFRIGHELLNEAGADGVDQVNFLFSSNKGIELDEISKIASGGELSRLMLSIKSLISGKNLLPTILFDEIDIGVSGEIAGKMGAMLKKMAKQMQVIAITHLPQIAGMGESHYFVYKVTGSETTQSLMKKLSHEERIREIAKMLSSDKVTASASRTASELLKN